MLGESFLSSIYAVHKTSNTSIPRDVGIYHHSLHPTHSIKTTYKKSSTHASCLASTPTHIFAAQADKAQVLVYSRDRSNQEALIAFPERIHSVHALHDGLIALGTAEGRITLWEVFTGRQVSTPTAHLQAVTCLASVGTSFLLSGSEDSNIHVWDVGTLMSTATSATMESLRMLNNHRAAITSLTIGHSSCRTNIAISTAKDNTAIVWNYASGTLLRTILLSSTPLCCALDPVDRACYIGQEDGTIQPVALIDPTTSQNTLYDTSLQSTPISASSPPFTGTNAGAIHCLCLNFDGTLLLSGHESGKLLQWDVGPQTFLSELADLNAPITNLHFLPSLQTPDSKVKAVQVVKPKLGDTSKTYALQVQFVGASTEQDWRREWENDGFSEMLLEEVMLGFNVNSTEEVGREGGDTEGYEKLKRENEELRKLVQEQRALNKRALDKIGADAGPKKKKSVKT